VQRHPPCTSPQVCTKTEELKAVTFTYNGATCNPKGNQQGDAASCTYYSPLLPGTVYTMICLDQVTGINMIIMLSPFNAATLTVMTLVGGNLPDKIMMCLLSSISDKSIFQEFVVDTSGNVKLQLSDQFGSFILVSCEDLTCIKAAQYKITMENIGTTSMDLMDLIYTFNGKAENALAEVTLSLFANLIWYRLVGSPPSFHDDFHHKLTTHGHKYDVMEMGVAKNFPYDRNHTRK